MKILKSLIAICTLALFSTCKQQTPNTPEPTPSPSPDSGPIAQPTTPSVVAVLGGRKPNNETLDWKNSIEIYTSRNEHVLVTLQLKSCVALTPDSQKKYYKIDTYHSTKPSYVGAKLGSWDDKLISHTGEACSGNFLLEIYTPKGASKGVSEIEVGTLKIKKTVWDHEIPDELSMNAYMEMVSWFAFKGHFDVTKSDFNQWSEQQPLTDRYVDVVLEHRISPYKHWVTGLNDMEHWVSKTQPNQMLVMPLSLTDTSDTKLKALDAKIKELKLESRVVSYLVDEPQPHQMPLIDPAIKKIKAVMPYMKILVTTMPNSQTTGVDIHVPVIDHWKKGIKEPYWLYTSCMAHSCGGSNADMGTPDLVVDRDSVHARAWPVVSFALGASNVLYFNTVEAYRDGLQVEKNYYRFTGNGDGTLLYPDVNSHQPIVSLRMKLVRQGLYDVEYYSKSGIDVSDLVSGPTVWSKDYEAYEKKRIEAGKKLDGKLTSSGG